MLVKIGFSLISPTDLCPVRPIMRRVHDHCNEGYSLLGEEKGIYLPGWELPKDNKTQPTNSPWVYRSMMDLNVRILINYRIIHFHHKLRFSKDFKRFLR